MEVFQRVKLQREEFVGFGWSLFSQAKRAETPSSPKSGFPKAEGERMAVGWMLARQGVARFEVYSSSTRWQREEWMLASDGIEKKRERKGYKGTTWKAPQNLGLFTCCFPLFTEIRSVTAITKSCCFHTFLSYDSLSLWSLSLRKFISNHLHM